MQNIDKTDYTVQDLLSSKNTSGLRLISGAKNVHSVIKDTNIIDNPDYFDWLNEGDFLLTTGYYFKDSEYEQLKTVQKLAERKCSGLGIKVKRYFDSIPPVMASEAERLGVPLIEVPLKYSLGNIMNEINNSKKLQKQGSEIYYNYLALFMQAANESEIAATLYTLLDNPVAIYNEQNDLSYFIDTSDCLENKYGFSLLKNSRMIVLSDDNIKSSGSIEIKNNTVVFNNHEIRYKVAPVFEGNQKLGHIVVFETNNTSNNNGEKAIEVAVMSLLLYNKKQHSADSASILGTNFLDQLLNGTLNPSYVKNGLAAANDFDETKKHLCIIVKVFTRYNDCLHNDIRSVFEKTAAKHGKSCRYLKKSNMLISFMAVGNLKQYYNTRKQFGDFIEDLSAALPAVCGNNFTIGIGEPVSEVALLKESYSQAYEAIRYVGLASNKPYNYFMDIKIYHLLEMVNNKELLGDFYNGYLHILINYDQKNNTELLRTLEQYLACNSNIAETAKLLYIHRNTVLNRLSKIRELMDSDLSNSRELLNYRLALIIMHILEREH
ncbi:MAG: PucR family transcriptional regulator ligand-binding domain-containing protein [Oscillospiraceae bacterium]|nr:PucR family transcriptional regulator ligand-binding domain-containing protein [Oscillospiraceae bacterium]